MLVAIDTNDKMRSEGAGLLAEVGVSIVPQITYHVDVHALGKLLSADAADEAREAGTHHLLLRLSHDAPDKRSTTVVCRQRSTVGQTVRRRPVALRSHVEACASISVVWRQNMN